MLIMTIKGEEMKKLTQAVLVVAIGSCNSYAGGDIAIVDTEPTIVTIDEASGFYAGLGVSTMSLRNDLSDEEFSSTGVTLQLGYQVYPYLAIEGRYTRGIGNLDYNHGNALTTNIDDYPADFSNVGIYIKPMYAIEKFNIYALLGYGQVELTNIPLGGEGISADRTENGFQWGLGASYDVWNEVSVFVDYVRFYDNDGFDGRATEANIVSDTWTLGVTYKF
jgi:opacity protein-like surface antigen